MKRWAVQLLWLLYAVIFVCLAVAAIERVIRFISRCRRRYLMPLQRLGLGFTLCSGPLEPGRWTACVSLDAWPRASSRCRREWVDRGPKGVVPAWIDKLDPATLNALAVYVHSLGGGQ
jgi:hypothetical protein